MYLCWKFEPRTVNMAGLLLTVSCDPHCSVMGLLDDVLTISHRRILH